MVGADMMNGIVAVAASKPAVGAGTAFLRTASTDDTAAAVNASPNTAKGSKVVDDILLTRLRH